MSSATAAAPQRRAADPARLWIVPILVGLLVYAVALTGARALLNDGDTLSHIAIGRWIIAHRAIPFHDPFSFTAHGRLWVPHEWLAETVFAVLYARLGWGGVVAATGLAAAAAFALLTRALDETLGARRAAIGAFAAFSLTEAHFLARPHVLAWPLLVVWFAKMIGARDANRAPSLWLLPVMVLWCNLHGGFVIGLFFAGLLAAEAVLAAPAEERIAAIRGWGFFLAGTVLAALASPNGIAALLLPLKMLKMHFALASISEWRAVDFASPDPIEAWIGLMILGGFTLGIRLPPSRVLMVLLLLWMALSHVRNEELLGIVAPLLVAAPLAVRLSAFEASATAEAGAQGARPGSPGSRPRGNDGSTDAERRGPDFRRTFIAGPALAAAILLVLFASARVLDASGLEPRGEVAPAAALAAARRDGLDGRHVFNSVRFGGYLLFQGVPTFIDGRADLFGDTFIERYVAAANAIGNWLPDLLDRYRVQWTLLEPSSPAATLLDHLLGWKRVYADRFAVIHVRTPPIRPAAGGNFFERPAAAGD